MLAITLHTPLPVIWTFTFGMIDRYARALPKLAPLINPLAGGGESDGEPLTDPDAIRASLKAIGVKSR